MISESGFDYVQTLAGGHLQGDFETFTCILQLQLALKPKFPFFIMVFRAPVNYPFIIPVHLHIQIHVAACLLLCCLLNLDIPQREVPRRCDSTVSSSSVLAGAYGSQSFRGSHPQFIPNKFYDLMKIICLIFMYL